MDYGIGVNRGQVLQLLLQVLLVGMTLGMTRTVVPALAESEFGVPRGSFMLLAAFVVAFGFVKGALNFVAGRLAERIGRQRVLLVGWLAAVPPVNANGMPVKTSRPSFWLQAASRQCGSLRTSSTSAQVHQVAA